MLADLAVPHRGCPLRPDGGVGLPDRGGHVGLPARGHRLPRPRRPPDDAALLDGLHHVDVAQGDLGFLDWSSRVPEQQVQQHPWIDLVLPMSGAATFLQEVQGEIEPLGPDDRYSLLLIPLRRSTFGRPLFRTQDEELGLGFDTLRAFPPGLDVEAALRFNRRLYDRCKQLGGSQYPISAVRLAVEDWVVHYGEQWDRLRRGQAPLRPRRRPGWRPRRPGPSSSLSACTALRPHRPATVTSPCRCRRRLRRGLGELLAARAGVGRRRRPRRDDDRAGRAGGRARRSDREAIVWGRRRPDDPRGGKAHVQTVAGVRPLRRRRARRPRPAAGRRAPVELVRRRRRTPARRARRPGPLHGPRQRLRRRRGCPGPRRRQRLHRRVHRGAPAAARRRRGPAGPAAPGREPTAGTPSCSRASRRAWSCPACSRHRTRPRRRRLGGCRSPCSPALTTQRCPDQPRLGRGPPVPSPRDPSAVPGRRPGRRRCHLVARRGGGVGRAVGARRADRRRTRRSPRPRRRLGGRRLPRRARRRRTRRSTRPRTTSPRVDGRLRRRRWRGGSASRGAAVAAAGPAGSGGAGRSRAWRRLEVRLPGERPTGAPWSPAGRRCASTTTS